MLVVVVCSSRHLASATPLLRTQWERKLGHEKKYWIQYQRIWALTKGKDIEKDLVRPSRTVSNLSTSSVHHVVQEDITGSPVNGTMSIQKFDVL